MIWMFSPVPVALMGLGPWLKLLGLWNGPNGLADPASWVLQKGRQVSNLWTVATQILVCSWLYCLWTLIYIPLPFSVYISCCVTSFSINKEIIQWFKLLICCWCGWCLFFSLFLFLFNTIFYFSTVYFLDMNWKVCLFYFLLFLTYEILKNPTLLLPQQLCCRSP